jgi:universal stress protein A
MKTILVPVDFSPVTRAVVAEAVSLARVSRARVILVHVVRPPAPIIDYGLVNLDISDMITASEKFARQQLAKCRRRLRVRGISTRTVQTVGFPTGEIAAIARKARADYIVIGSHGHTAFYDLVIGSTTSGVLKAASCPVVIVPAQTRKRAAKR